MGRKSLNRHNNKYLQIRQERGLTREEASELLEYISEDRLEKIENNRANIHPDEVLLMAEKYKKPSLCNYYCSQECPIGRIYVPQLEISGLKEMTFDMIMYLERISKDRDRLLEIVEDGKINKDELEDFRKIEKNLMSISKSIQTLQLFIKENITNIDTE